jgi:phosphatidate cytidylyltransferase
VTVAASPPLPPGSLPQRALVALLVAGGFAALCWADATGLLGARPGWWLAPLALAIAAGGATEVVRMAAARGLPLRPWLVPTAAAVLPLVPLVAAAIPAGWPRGGGAVGLGWLAAATVAVLMVMFVAEIAGYRRADGALGRLAGGFGTAAAIGLPLAFMLDLRLRSPGSGGLGLVPLASMLAVVKGGDIAAYLVGSLFGRRRMAPVLSPGKTWEGAAASLAASLAVAWLVLAWSGWATARQPWGGWPVYGLALGPAGMLGDLSESLVKRELAAKDSGRSLGALGGFLDLADAALFAAPVAWALWILGGPPA